MLRRARSRLARGARGGTDVAVDARAVGHEGRPPLARHGGWIVRGPTRAPRRRFQVKTTSIERASRNAARPGSRTPRAAVPHRRRSAAPRAAPLAAICTAPSTRLRAPSGWTMWPASTAQKTRALVEERPLHAIEHAAARAPRWSGRRAAQLLDGDEQARRQRASSSTSTTHTRRTRPRWAAAVGNFCATVEIRCSRSRTAEAVQQAGARGRTGTSSPNAPTPVVIARGRGMHGEEHPGGADQGREAGGSSSGSCGVAVHPTVPRARWSSGEILRVGRASRRRRLTVDGRRRCSSPLSLRIATPAISTDSARVRRTRLARRRHRAGAGRLARVGRERGEPRRCRPPGTPVARSAPNRRPTGAHSTPAILVPTGTFLPGRRPGRPAGARRRARPELAGGGRLTLLHVFHPPSPIVPAQIPSWPDLR